MMADKMIEQIKPSRSGEGLGPWTRDMEARILADAEVIEAAEDLAEWVEGIIGDGCPKCGGDCSSASPPVAYCPMLELTQDLAAFRQAQDRAEKGGE